MCVFVYNLSDIIGLFFKKPQPVHDVCCSPMLRVGFTSRYGVTFAFLVSDISSFKVIAVCIYVYIYICVCLCVCTIIEVFMHAYKYTHDYTCIIFTICLKL